MQKVKAQWLLGRQLTPVRLDEFTSGHLWMDML